VAFHRIPGWVAHYPFCFHYFRFQPVCFDDFTSMAGVSGGIFPFVSRILDQFNFPEMKGQNYRLIPSIGELAVA
jgi:hypothetical protein